MKCCPAIDQVFSSPSGGSPFALDPSSFSFVGCFSFVSDFCLLAVSYLLASVFGEHRSVSPAGGNSSANSHMSTTIPNEQEAKREVHHLSAGERRQAGEGHHDTLLLAASLRVIGL